MKKLVIISSMIFLAACSGKNKKSDAYGNFEADEVIISSEVSGKLIHFDLEEGNVIDSGKLIGLIDTNDLQLKKEQLIAQKNATATKSPNIASQVEVQKQQKSNLLIDKARLEKLYKDGAATKKQLDDIDASINLVDKQILSVQTQNGSIGDELTGLDKQIAQIDQNIKKSYLVNPLKGTILDKYMMQDELVTPGKSLYKIADLSTIYLRVYVSEAQLSSIKLGQNVEVLIDKGNNGMGKYEGLLTWISSSAEFTPKIIQTKEERVNLVYAVKVKVKNDGALKIGMPGEVNFK